MVGSDKSKKLKDMRKLVIVSLFLLGGILQAQNFKIDPDILQKAWKAYWIAVPNEPALDYGVYCFKKDITLSLKPETYVIHVSADNRYKLFVNGQVVSIGPALGDINHWNFETVDIAPYLKSGINVIAAMVWNDGDYRAIMQISNRTAFIMQGNTKKEFEVNTNKSWRCSKIKAYAPLEQKVNGYYVLGPGEFVDMNLLNSDLLMTDSEQDKWSVSEMVGLGMPKGSSSLLPAGKWMLVPSSIPSMEMTYQRILKMRTAKGVSAPAHFPEKKADLTIPSNTTASILLDQTFLTNSYLTLLYSKGKDASVSIRYAESLYDKNSIRKGNRSEVENKKIVGRNDSIICNGFDNQRYTTLSWRTFRYIQLDIQTKGEPLIINDIYGTFTGYPFKNNTTFNSDMPLLNDILQVGWRTARLCAVETYFDCPYYEQLQYIGDTRIQAMISYYNSGDDRLGRKAIDVIDYSRLPEGITQSRYPSSVVQIIPPYSLFWIGMVYDYYLYRNDSDYVRSKLQGSRQVLEFFSGYQQEDGSLNNVPYWNFTDWADRSPRSWKFGTSPNDNNGNSCVLDLQLLWAYQVAAEMERNIGENYYAQKYTESINKLRETIKKKYWDKDKGMFADNAEMKVFSQHANSLAILTETVTGSEAFNVYEHIMNDSDIVKASIYFQYYLNLAMKKVGLGNNYLEQLGIWKKNIELSMTTWGEDSDVEKTRSDCHAWGASPNIEFFRIVLGIDSDGPGFSKVKIEPHLGELTRASGSIPHWNGEISVNYTLKGNEWDISVELPKTIDGVFIWKDKKYNLQTGKNNFVIDEK